MILLIALSLLVIGMIEAQFGLIGSYYEEMAAFPVYGV